MEIPFYGVKIKLKITNMAFYIKILTAKPFVFNQKIKIETVTSLKINLFHAVLLIPVSLCLHFTA